MDRHALALEAALDQLGDVGVLGGQHALECLEQEHLDAQPRVARGDLGTRGAGADDAPSIAGSSASAQASSVPITRPPNCAPGIGSLDRAGGEHDRLGRDLLAADRHGALAGQRGLALDQVDLVLLEQARDAAGERRDDLLAACGDGRRSRPRGSADLDPELAGLADLGQHVGDAQHGLGGDAGVVEAAAADLVLLDHGGLHPELRGADRGDVATRPGADDHAVVSGIGHVSQPIQAAQSWRAGSLARPRRR